MLLRLLEETDSDLLIELALRALSDISLTAGAADILASSGWSRGWIHSPA